MIQVRVLPVNYQVTAHGVKHFVTLLNLLFWEFPYSPICVSLRVGMFQSSYGQCHCAYLYVLWILTSGSGRAAILSSYRISNHMLLHQTKSPHNGLPGRILSTPLPTIQRLRLAAITVSTVIPLYFMQLVSLQAQIHSKQVPIFDRN